MLTESTVLLVWTSQSPELLAEQLELHEVFVESTPLDDVERTLPVVGPDLLVHVGREGVERVVALLADQTGARRVRLALVAPRASLEELRKLDRSLVLSVLPDDLPPKMLVERIAALARRSGGAALATASPRPAVPRPAALPRPVPAPAPAPVAIKSAAGAALPSGSAKRVALIDDDVTRADIVGTALRERGFAVKLLPTDTDRVRWPHLRQFAPEVLVTDGADRPPYGWLERLRTDAELQAVRLVTVPYGQIFAETAGIATLAPLLDRISHLGLPGSSASLEDEDDRPTLIADDDRPTLVATDEHRAELEASAAPAREQRSASAEVTASSEGERESGAPVSIDDIESILPEPLDSDRPSEDLPTVPFGLPTQELLAAARASQSFKVEPSPAGGASDVETPEVPQSQDVDSLLDSLERASLEAAGAGTSTDGPVSVSPASLVEGRVAAWHESSNDSSGVAAPSGVGPAGAAESDAALAISAVKDTKRGESTAATHALVGPPLREKQGSAGRWLGLGAAALLVVAGGYWMVRERGASVGASTAAAVSEVATSAATPEKPPSAPGSAAPPANAANSPKSETTAAEPGVSQAPWRVAEKTELTRCERQVGDYASLPETDVEQASRSWEKARSALLLGDLEKARDLMCRAVLMHPESLALEGLAETYLTLGSPEQAKLWVDAAIRLRPDRQKTRELLGDIENQRGRVDESRDLWVKTFALAPDDQKTLDWLAKKLVGEAQGALRAGSTHRAEILYRRAATLSGSNADAPAGLARLALKAGNQEQAGRWVTVAVDRTPGHSDALVVQGDLALARGDSESARQTYQRALEKNPFNRTALEQLARLDRK